MKFYSKVVLISALTVFAAPHSFAQSFLGKSITTRGAYNLVYCREGRCNNLGMRPINVKFYIAEDGWQAFDYITGGKRSIGRPDDAGLVLTVSGNKMALKTTRDDAGTNFNFTNLGSGKCRMNVSTWAKKGTARATEIGPIRCTVADGDIFAR